MGPATTQDQRHPRFPDCSQQRQSQAQSRGFGDAEGHSVDSGGDVLYWPGLSGLALGTERLLAEAGSRRRAVHAHGRFSPSH